MLRDILFRLEQTRGFDKGRFNARFFMMREKIGVDAP